ncbi:MAG: efflux RND transporter periplasmic adaptor subunit [Bryobacteraceae bacterium]|nr:efflux RND transporter periplasmic adaptor subunit [Bryobacteraceae bacterium]
MLIERFMTTLRRWFPALAALVLLAVAGAAGYNWYRSRNDSQKRSDVSATKQNAGQSVAEVGLSGMIYAREVVNVGAGVEGQVLSFHAEVGDEVYEGQLLAEISNQNLANAREESEEELTRAQTRIDELEVAVASGRLEASRAQADLTRVRGEHERATRNVNRQKMLIAEGATPRQSYDRAEAEYKTLGTDLQNLEAVAGGAEARLASLQSELDNARKQLEARVLDLEAAQARLDAGQVFSPASGIVTSRRGTPGEDVHPSVADFFQIATNLSNLTVLVEPQGSVLASIKQGQTALVNVADIPNDVLTGTVASVTDGKVRVDFVSPSALVKPGQTAQVRLMLR